MIQLLNLLVHWTMWKQHNIDRFELFDRWQWGPIQSFTRQFFTGRHGEERDSIYTRVLCRQHPGQNGRPCVYRILYIKGSQLRCKGTVTIYSCSFDLLVALHVLAGDMLYWFYNDIRRKTVSWEYCTVSWKYTVCIFKYKPATGNQGVHRLWKTGEKLKIFSLQGKFGEFEKFVKIRGKSGNFIFIYNKVDSK